MHTCINLFNLRTQITFNPILLIWVPVYIIGVELVWCSGSVIDCHTTDRGSIHYGNCVKT